MIVLPSDVLTVSTCRVLASTETVWLTLPTWRVEIKVQRVVDVEIDVVDDSLLETLVSEAVSR